MDSLWFIQMFLLEHFGFVENIPAFMLGYFGFIPNISDSLWGSFGLIEIFWIGFQGCLGSLSERFHYCVHTSCVSLNVFTMVIMMMMSLRSPSWWSLRNHHH